MTNILDHHEEVIYLQSNSTNTILSIDMVKEYINDILQNSKLTHLDAIKLTNNIYPKLKEYNTVDDINDQIMMSATDLSMEHYDYPSIVVYILVKKLHETTHNDYLKVVTELWENKNEEGDHAPIICREFYEFVISNHEKINIMFDYQRDYNINLFGYRTLEKAYLKKNVNNKIIERPQHLYMRVAIAIHYTTPNLTLDERLDKIMESYELMSQGYFTHATPTLFNSGSPCQQLSSCFLMGINDDMYDIGNAGRDFAMFSKFAGGVGMWVTPIRCNGSYIKSTQGRSSGLRFLKVINEYTRYADQGGKRAGSIAIYLEPWHGDIEYFLDLRKNTGSETERARDLFLALMVNDVFMQRVLDDKMWSLMCPSKCPKLLNKYGDEFTKIYEEYEAMGRYLKQMPARELWFDIMESQIETGTPYILYKDAINKKSNQKNIGVINGSNLCAEITLYSDANEYAVCNLASLCLPKYIENNEFNFKKLYDVTRIVTRNLNNVIDINFYPLEKAKISNMKNRPIGIGVQGLADVFAMFKTPFDSELAKDLNKKIFETIYFGSLTESMELAKMHGPYETFKSSPISQGLFQFDLWDKYDLSGMWDWNTLRENILRHGVYNSVTTAPMPTASTSQILGTNECFEPFTSNVYLRSTLAGQFYVVNKYLMKDLMNLNLWNDDIIDQIKYYDGSIQNIKDISDNIKKIYRTSSEIPQKSLIEMSADRGPFVDQTQSMNIFIDKPSYPRLNSCHFKAWRLGLKTGMYYLRSKPASEANKFGIDIDKIKEIENNNNLDDNIICVRRPKDLGSDEMCMVCSS